MRPNPQEAANLITVTDEVLNGKLHFLCSDTQFLLEIREFDSPCFHGQYTLIFAFIFNALAQPIVAQAHENQGYTEDDHVQPIKPAKAENPRVKALKKSFSFRFKRFKKYEGRKEAMMEKSKEAPSTEDPYNISLSELEIPIDEPDKKGGLIKTNTGKYPHLRETTQLIYSVNQYFGVYGIDTYDFKCINRKD